MWNKYIKYLQNQRRTIFFKGNSYVVGSEYVPSVELDDFAKTSKLSRELVWWLAQHGFQTLDAILCMRGEDMEKTGLPLADTVKLREAIRKHGTAQSMCCLLFY